MSSSRWLHRVHVLVWETPMTVFLVAGVVIVSAVLLVGPYLENRQLAWQRDLARLQVERLARQEKNYQEMEAALEARDPALLERLAFHYLHLKPVGVQVLGGPDPARPATMFTGTGANVQPSFVAERAATIEQWLYCPPPVVGVDIPRYSMLDTFLTRAAAGPQRLLVVAAGCVCILFGLIPVSRMIRKPADMVSSAPQG